MVQRKVVSAKVAHIPFGLVKQDVGSGTTVLSSHEDKRGEREHLALKGQLGLSAAKTEADHAPSIAQIEAKEIADRAQTLDLIPIGVGLNRVLLAIFEDQLVEPGVCSKLPPRQLRRSQGRG